MVQIILFICKSKPKLLCFPDRFNFVLFTAILIILLLHADIHFQCVLTLLQQCIPKSSERNHLLPLCSHQLCSPSEINLYSVNKSLINTLSYWHQPQEQIKSPANYSTILGIRQLICSQIYHLDIPCRFSVGMLPELHTYHLITEKPQSNLKVSSLCKIKEKATRRQIFLPLPKRCRICC